MEGKEEGKRKGIREDLSTPVLSVVVLFLITPQFNVFCKDVSFGTVMVLTLTFFGWVTEL